MTDSSVNYRAIPSSEDQAYHSDVREAAVGMGNFYATTCERISAEAQTKWTYFLLGCAILLPWNGDPFARLPMLLVLLSAQLWPMQRRFSCLDWQAPRSIRPSVHTCPASAR